MAPRAPTARRRRDHVRSPVRSNQTRLHLQQPQRQIRVQHHLFRERRRSIHARFRQLSPATQSLHGRQIRHVQSRRKIQQSRLPLRRQDDSA